MLVCVLMLEWVATNVHSCEGILQESIYGSEVAEILDEVSLERRNLRSGIWYR